VLALERCGWSVFWDGDIQPAENWHQSIATKLEAASCTITLWTTNSVRSYWVIEEAMYAHRRGVLLPVLLDDISPPPGFLSLQCADLIGWNGDDTSPAFKQLEAAIAKLAGAPVRLTADEEPTPTQTPIQTRTPADSRSKTEPAPGRPHIYEGESLPWLNWTVLFVALSYPLFGDALIRLLSNLFEDIVTVLPLQAAVPVVLTGLTLLNFQPIIWSAKRYNSKEVSAMFVLSSLALYYLMGLVCLSNEIRISDLQPVESGQFVASLLLIVLAVAVWLARSYQKSWLEIGFLWLVASVAVVIASVFGLMLYYEGSYVGYGRLDPRSTGLLVGSVLIAFSTTALVVVKFRHLSAAELAFYWFFGSLGLISTLRSVSIAQYGRRQELETLSGTLFGLALSLAIGVSLISIRYWSLRNKTRSRPA